LNGPRHLDAFEKDQETMQNPRQQHPFERRGRLTSWVFSIVAGCLALVVVAVLSPNTSAQGRLAALPAEAPAPPTTH